MKKHFFNIFSMNSIKRHQRLIILSALIQTFSLTISAQSTIIKSSNNTIAPFGGKVETFSKITEVLYEKKVLGSFYLDSAWKNSDIYLTKDSLILKNIKTRLDLKNNIIEILDNGTTKVLSSNEIRSIFYPTNKNLFITESLLNKCPSGFYSIINNAQTALLCKYGLKVKRSNYNPTLDTGNRDDQLIITKSYYFSENNITIEIPKSKSKLKKLFLQNSKLSKFIKTHNVNPQNKADLTILVDYINDNNIQLSNLNNL